MQIVLDWLSTNRDTAIYLITIVVFIHNIIPELITAFKRAKHESKCHYQHNKSQRFFSCGWRYNERDRSEFERNNCNNCSCIGLDKSEERKDERQECRRERDA